MDVHIPKPKVPETAMKTELASVPLPAKKTHSKASFAHTVDKTKRIQDKSRKSLYVYLRSRFNGAKEFLAVGHEDPQSLRKELLEIAELLKGLQ